MEHTISLEFEEAIWGKKLPLKIHKPDDKGAVHEETIEIKIPAGVTNGSKIRLRGKGDPGISGGPAGDLYIVTKVKNHPYFERVGDDIYLDLPITAAEAIRGVKVTIPTLDGQTILTIPAGTNSGQKLRLKGKGAPNPKNDSRGDQYAKIKIIVPKKLPKEIDEALDEIQSATGDPREELNWAV